MLRTDRVSTRRTFLQSSALAGAGALLLGKTSRFAWGQAAGGSPGKVAGLTAERFRELHAELAPEEGEPLQAIPWKIATQDARKLAVEQKRPILMLSRSGHPLGCV
ncbi:MAG: hypothetical protein WD066_00620 [Planctomycetaceae bacterium]